MVDFIDSRSKNNINWLVKLQSSDLGPKLLSFLELGDALGLELVCTALSLRDSYFKDKLGCVMNNRGSRAPIVQILSNNSSREVYKGVWYTMRRVHLEKANLMEECFEVSDDIVRSCSSTDREEESPKNVLQRSFCQDMLHRGNMMGLKVPDEEATIDNLTPMAHTQIRCGCATSAACYYCCKASPTADVREWINMSLSRFAYLSTGRPLTRRQERAMEEFETLGDVVVLDKFGVIPYRSYLQPYGPTYAPRQVKLQIFYGDAGALDVSEGCLYYESEEYEVRHVEGEQVFALPQPICLLTSNRAGSPVFSVRIVFLGAHQRQTFSEHTGVPHHNWYYICISQVTLYGASLQRTTAILRDHMITTSQPRHAAFFQNSPMARSEPRSHLQFLDTLARASITASISCSADSQDTARIMWVAET